LLNKYQNPKEADALTKLQIDLDETKIILVRKKPTSLYMYMHGHLAPKVYGQSKKVIFESFKVEFNAHLKNKPSSTLHNPLMI
jgi:hypothetical protein